MGQSEKRPIVVFLDPHLLQGDELQRALSRFDPGSTEVVGFENTLQPRLVHDAGFRYVSAAPDPWTSREKLAFLSEVYQIYHEVEHHPASSLVPWPERFPYTVSAGVLLRQRPEQGTNLCLQIGYLLDRHRDAWRGSTAHALAATSTFTDIIRHVAPALGVHLLPEAGRAKPGSRTSLRQKLRGQRGRFRGALEVAGLRVAHRLGSGPSVHIREHRSTAAVIRCLAAVHVRPVPPPRNHVGILRMNRRVAAEWDTIGPRFDEALAQVERAVRAARPPGWSLAVETFFAVCRPGMLAMMQEVARTWWHLDTYRPQMIVEHDWYQPTNHAAWTWSIHHHVPFAIMVHGEGGVLTGQFQLRSLKAREVYCWSRSFQELLRSVPELGGTEIVHTGNPAYDALQPPRTPVAPVEIRSVLVALSAYTGVWADEELRSWQAIARIAAEMPELRWKLRGHRAGALESGFDMIFGSVPVETSDRATESFFEAAASCDLVVTNLSTARTDTIALGKLLLVWNDLGVHDPLNERPGMVVVNSERELKELIAALATDGTQYARLLDEQILSCQRELLPSSATEAVVDSIVDTLRSAPR